MQMSADQFIETLSASGLLSANDARAVLLSFPLDQRLVGGKELADELVRQKKMTEFQANCLLRGRTLPLVLDEYVILDRIGAGGMGQVFTAMHTHMERVVALKVMHERALNSLEAIERFDREVKMAARLSHPNIVTAYDAGHCHGVHYLVMEYVKGRDLHTLAETKPLRMDVAVKYVRQAAHGLDYAHGKGIIHRDIKPGNLLVDEYDTVRILDMGIARAKTPKLVDRDAVTEAKLTQAGVIIGSIDFMSPEQAANAENVDARSDIYSLGCTLFYLLTGRAVFRGDTVVEKLFARHEQEIPAISKLRSDVPSALDAVIRKMIARRPDGRYQSMNELIGALEVLGDILDDILPSHSDRLTTLNASGSETIDAVDNAQPPIETALWQESPACEALRKFIEGCAPDRFIDIDEEYQIFRKGGELQLSSKDVEEVIAQMCHEGGWGRQSTLCKEIVERFQKAVDETCAVQQTDFDDAVRYAVQHGMRRKAAIEECLTLILDNDLDVGEDDENAWFSKKLDRFGLD